MSCGRRLLLWTLARCSMTEPIFVRPERVPLPQNVRLSPEMVSELDELAARHQTTRSRIIRGLLEQGLKQHKMAAQIMPHREVPHA